MGKASRERELKKAFGPEVAEAMAELRTQVTQVGMGSRVLARQMLDVERDVATIRQGRAHDKQDLGSKVDDLRDQLEALRLRLDGAENSLLQSNTSMCRVLCWIRHYRELTRWERFRAFLAGRCAVTFDPFVTPADTASLQSVMKAAFAPDGE